MIMGKLRAHIHPAYVHERPLASSRRRAHRQGGRQCRGEYQEHAPTSFPITRAGIAPAVAALARFELSFLDAVDEGELPVIGGGLARGFPVLVPGAQAEQLGLVLARCFARRVQEVGAVLASVARHACSRRLVPHNLCCVACARCEYVGGGGDALGEARCTSRHL